MVNKLIPSLEKITFDSFINNSIVNKINVNQKAGRKTNIAFFIGAGCSKSSGIPTSGELVEKWKDQYEKDNPGFFLEDKIKSYDPKFPSKSYNECIELLYENPDDRTNLLEDLTKDALPGFGYYLLSKIISHEIFGSHFKYFLTTNFDDLLSMALYLYTNKRPLVINNHHLAKYINHNPTERPLIIKIHGDTGIENKNTKTEVEEIEKNFEAELLKIIQQLRIIFIGYSGEDDGIFKIFNKVDKMNNGCYWVNPILPDGNMKHWLVKVNAKWIDHLDFDEFMLSLANKTGIKFETEDRINEIIENHQCTFNKLISKIENMNTLKHENISKLINVSDNYAKYHEIKQHILNKYKNIGNITQLYESIIKDEEVIDKTDEIESKLSDLLDYIENNFDIPYLLADYIELLYLSKKKHISSKMSLEEMIEIVGETPLF